MRNRVDLLPVTWHQLNVSAFNRVWIKLGFGVQARARRSTQGFDVRIRYGTNDVIQKSRVEVREVPWRAGKQLRPTLVCSVCGKPTTKQVYLGSDFRFSCARCLGVPSWKIRMPMQWDLGEEVRFRRLLKRKLDQDILQFELAALRTLSPSDFFASRPYLVPEWVARVRDLDGELHKKLLRVIHGKYRSVMMRRRVVFLNEREDEWLMSELLKVFGKAAIITKKEITWLRNRQPQLRSSDYHLQKNEESAPQSPSLESGFQSGSPSTPSALPPSETAFSLSRTSLSQVTTAELAEALEKQSVELAEAAEHTQEVWLKNLENLSAQPVTQQEKLPVESVEEKEHS